MPLQFIRLELEPRVVLPEKRSVAGRSPLPLPAPAKRSGWSILRPRARRDARFGAQGCGVVEDERLSRHLAGCVVAPAVAVNVCHVSRSIMCGLDGHGEVVALHECNLCKSSSETGS